MGNAWRYYLDEESFGHAISNFWNSSAYVLSCTVQETLMWPYKIDAIIALDGSLKKQHLGGVICINFGPKGHPFRTFVGTLFKFEYLGSTGTITKQNISLEQFVYKIELYHELKKLSLNSEFRIFQNKTKKEIISSILENTSIKTISKIVDSKNVSQLSNTQYNENTLDYIVRLMQEEGYITYFDMNYYTADDVNKGVKPILVQPKYVLVQKIDASKSNVIELKYQDIRVGEYTLNQVINFTYATDVPIQSFSLFDYNFVENNQLISNINNSSSIKTKKEIYPAIAINNTEIQNVTKNISVEHLSREIKFKAETTAFALTPGKILKITNANQIKDQYFVESVRHELEKTENGWIYKNFAEGVKYSADYLPEKTLKKPLVFGTQTAIVVGDAKNQETNIDKYGRVQVKFHWINDADNNKNDAKKTVATTNQPSAWIRVMQWGAAGQSWGNVSMPRVGQEVVVGFLNADSDSPIILGSVFNGGHDFPYSMPDNADTLVLRTHTTEALSQKIPSYNEFSMKDTPMRQKVFLRAQNDLEMKILNNSLKQVDGRDITMIKSDCILNISKGSRFTSFGPFFQKPSEVSAFALIGSAFIGAQIEMLTMQTGVNFTYIASGAIGMIVEIGAMTFSLKKGLMMFNTQLYSMLATSDSSMKIFGTNLLFVSGNNRTSVGGNNIINVSGANRVSVSGLYETKVKGIYSNKIKGEYSIDSLGPLKLKGNIASLESKTKMDIKTGMQLDINSAAFNLSSKGILKIEASQINISAKMGITITAQAINMKSNTIFKLEAGALVTIKGAIIQLN